VLTFIVGTATGKLWINYRHEVIKKQLLSLTDEMHRAYVQKDAEALSAILAHDAGTISSYDSFMEKPMGLERVNNSELMTDSITIEEVKVRVFNEEDASVSGFARVKERLGNQTPRDEKVRFVYRYAKRQGVWQVWVSIWRYLE
jgi:hypothetical protein